MFPPLVSAAKTQTSYALPDLCVTSGVRTPRALQDAIGAPMAIWSSHNHEGRGTHAKRLLQGKRVEETKKSKLEVPPEHVFNFRAAQNQSMRRDM